MDAVIGLLVLLAGVCFVLKMIFLWSAIASLFKSDSPREPSPAQMADEVIERARRRARRQKVSPHWTEDEQ